MSALKKLRLEHYLELKAGLGKSDILSHKYYIFT